MSVEPGLQAEETLPTSFTASQDAQSDLGDGSSSLSDIEDKEGDHDNIDDEGSGEELEDDPEREHELEVEDEDEDDQDVDMDSDGNDSEAETERLENSPHTARRHKDVVLSSQAESRTYERSPSKLQQSYAVNDDLDDEDADALSDEERSATESPNGLTNGRSSSTLKNNVSSIEEAKAVEGLLAVHGSFSKKRKRSLLPERRSPDPEDLDEPARKRTGSIIDHGDDFAIDDAVSGQDDNGASNPISGEVSEAESEQDEDEIQANEGVMDDASGKDETDGTTAPSTLDADGTTKIERHVRSRSRRSAGVGELTVHAGHDNEEETNADNTQDIPVEDADDHDAEADNEADEAEIALKNEEEQERKRLSLDLLSNIQRQFESFKKTLFDERMAQLEREEGLLKSSPPSHPQYLEMMKCIDARRDDKLRIEANLTKYKLESMQRTVVAQRSQILAQFQQEVREIRERVLEKTGKMWYEIQNDRRGYGSQVEEYAIRFPTKKSMQVMHHNQYTKEVSLLSGMAKHVGFPAAPKINGASRSELDADLEKMGKTHQHRQTSHRIQQGLPDLAALRAAGSASSYKPAEEQFIEQTPWANPQHPSHAQFIQRESSGTQIPRTASPFGAGAGGNRKQHTSGPTMGLFTSAGHGPNHAQASGGRASPINPFTATSISHKPATLSTNNRHLTKSPDDIHRHGEAVIHGDGKVPQPDKTIGPEVSAFSFNDGNSFKREQSIAVAGRF